MNKRPDASLQMDLTQHVPGGLYSGTIDLTIESQAIQREFVVSLGMEMEKGDFLFNIYKDGALYTKITTPLVNNIATDELLELSRTEQILIETFYFPIIQAVGELMDLSRPPRLLQRIGARIYDFIWDRRLIRQNNLFCQNEDAFMHLCLACA